MKRNFVLLVAAATLAACGGIAPQAGSDGYVSAPVVSEDVRTTLPWHEQSLDTIAKHPETGTTVLLVGMGHVVSIASLGDLEHGVMAGPLRRVGVRMGDGRVQFLDTHAPRLAVGARVEITKEGNIRYPAATSVPASSRG